MFLAIPKFLFGERPLSGSLFFRIAFNDDLGS